MDKKLNLFKQKKTIAIDWSHTKGLTTYDGEKFKVENRKALLKRIAESILPMQSTHRFQAILEQGCPLSLCYDLLRVGTIVFLISNKSTEEYRKAHGIEKSDENDAKIIYELAINGAKLQELKLTDKIIQMHDIYHQYCRYQKARVALQNMKKAHRRHYRSGESIPSVLSMIRLQPESEGSTGESKRILKSIYPVYPVPDLLPYDIAIDTLEAREKSLLKTLEETARGLPLFEGGESIANVYSNITLHPPTIKGLGRRLWLGIMITANPTNFKRCSAYLRYCGLTDVVKTGKYNHHARMLYHLLAEETMKLRDPKFRPLYDKCKEDIKKKYPDYTKGHIHNASLNRVATFLAKTIYNHRRS